MAKMERHTILGVHLTDRLEEAVAVQKLLTSFGGYIKTRLGLHEVATDGGPVGSKNGLVLLEMVGPEGKASDLASQLNAIKGVEVKTMIFTHEELE